MTEKPELPDLWVDPAFPNAGGSFGAGYRPHTARYIPAQRIEDLRARIEAGPLRLYKIAILAELDGLLRIPS